MCMYICMCVGGAGVGVLGGAVQGESGTERDESRSGTAPGAQTGGWLLGGVAGVH